MIEHRRAFWGKEPSAEQRRNLMHGVILDARRAYLAKASVENLDPTQYKNQLVFMADGMEMCELAFTHMLGVSTAQGFRSKAWIDELEMFTGNLPTNSIALVCEYNL